MANKPHRILCLQHSSIFEAYGGVEYYLDDLLSMLASIYGEQNVTTLVPVRRTSTQITPRDYRVIPVPWGNSPLQQRAQNRVPVSMAKAAWKAIREHRPTLILNAHVSLGPLAVMLARISQTPVATVAYGIDVWGNLWPQDEVALRCSDQILSISHWTKNVLVGRGYAREKIQIVPPIMNPKFEANELQKKSVQDPFTLLTISRLDANEQYKGQDHVLQALSMIRASHPHLKLHYIIQGKGTDLPRLQELVKTLQLESVVEFIQELPSRDGLSKLYSSADVYVMPSRFGYWDRRWRGEGFGIVYVEAAAFGVPSIAYACGGATDIIVDGKTGLLTSPDNIHDLARAIVTLAENPTYTRELGEQAYVHVMQKFARTPVLRDLSETFARL